jgi:hypothetical protein
MFPMATHVFSSFFWCFCKCFRLMLQVFQLFRTYVASDLDVAKVDRVLYMFIIGPTCHSHLLQDAGAPPWVIVWAPEAGRRIRSVASTGGGK